MVYKPDKLQNEFVAGVDVRPAALHGKSLAWGAAGQEGESPGLDVEALGKFGGCQGPDVRAEYVIP